MDFTLTDEQAALRDLAADVFGRADGGTTPADWFDRNLWKRLAAAGLLGACLPRDTGGSGLGFVALHLLLAEAGAEAAQVPLWETLVLGVLPVAAFGTPAQRADLLPAVAAGDVVLTAGFGDPVAPGVHAEPVTSGWRLAGTTAAAPAAPIADRILIPATTPALDLNIFVVDRHAPGVSLQLREVMSGRPYAAVTLHDVEVAPDALLGAEDQGDDLADWVEVRSQVALASLTAGACRGAVRLAAAHATTREQFGRPLASFQAVGQRLADAYIDSEGVGLTALYASWLLEQQQGADQEALIAAWWAAEAGHRVLAAAQHVHGGLGVDRSYPVHRYYLLGKEVESLLGGATRSLLRLGARFAAETETV